MRKALWSTPLVALFITCFAYAGGAIQSRSVCYTATMNSQAAPTGNPLVQPADPAGWRSCWQTDGGPGGCVAGAIRLTGARGYNALLAAGGTATLSGAGSLQAYKCPEMYSLPDAGNPCTGTWPRNPGIDEQVTVTATSCAGSACPFQQFPDRTSPGTNSGWLFLAPTSVTESAGASGAVCVELVGTPNG